jgi:hypothetical protein
MTPELKEKLLLRLFSSVGYMEAFTQHYAAALLIAEDAFSIFENKFRANPDLSNRYAMEFRQWKERVIPNFSGMRANATEALQNAKSGHLSTIRSATGNLRGLSKDMDGIGWDWWNEIEESYRSHYSKNISKAQTMGDNIYFTLSDFWDAGEILNEQITGPIDEQQLLVFLLPGEPV